MLKIGELYNNLKIELRARFFKNVRQALSLKFISGRGIEIGALHSPLSVKENTKVYYIDRIHKLDAIATFPELDPSSIIKTDIVGDGFTLDTIKDSIFDFVIANHVLEHSPNPLGILEAWGKKLRKGGIIFVSVPIANQCFDRGRLITTLEHFIKDQEIYNKNLKDEIILRNKEHYTEWVSISEPAILQLKKQRNKEEIENAVNFLQSNEEEIHFHTFTPNSFKKLLNYFCINSQQNFKLKELKTNSIEIVGILKNT